MTSLVNTTRINGFFKNILVSDWRIKTSLTQPVSSNLVNLIVRKFIGLFGISNSGKGLLNSFEQSIWVQITGDKL